MTGTIALAAVVAIVLTMPVYAVVSRGRPLDPEVARRPATVLLGYWVRDWVMWMVTPLERALIGSGISPDVLNVLGAVMGFAAGVAYARGAPEIAGWFIILGGVADIMDGRVARARNLVSPYGEFLDSMLDRFSEVFAFVGLGLYLAPIPSGIPATVLAAGSSLLVSYARAKGDAVGVACRGGVMQRAERLVLLALTSLVDRLVTSSAGWHEGTMLLAAVWLIGLGALGTAIYRTLFIARALKPKRADGERP